MVGPGIAGALNTATDVSLNATLRGVSVERGGLAIGSHAVGLGLGLLGHAAARRLGVSVFVSLGNRADAPTSDLLEWCEDDERTAAVMLYVESLRRSATVSCESPSAWRARSPSSWSREAASGTLM